jgi:hypothetical protein
MRFGDVVASLSLRCEELVNAYTIYTTAADSPNQTHYPLGQVARFLRIWGWNRVYSNKPSIAAPMGTYDTKLCVNTG